MTKVVLAYSGSLDTAICLSYLKHIKGMKVYTFSANLGQPEYLEPLAEKAVDLGATAAHLADLREKFADNYILPCVRAGAVYEGGYHLFSALSRPLIVEELVAIAREEGCDYLAHGSRGIGNDRIRIEAAVKALAPDMQVLSPLEEIGLSSPEDDLAYARAHGIPFESERRTLYNIEQNMWGNDIQVRHCDTWEETPRDTYILTVPPSETPARVTTIDVEYRQGIPVGVDGEELSLVKLIDRLQKIGGRCAIGRYDIIENRISGRKTREVYESPAATILYAGLKAIEDLCLEKEVLRLKEVLSRAYADFVYEGKWFSQVREGLDEFFKKIGDPLTGTVRMSLYKGALTVVGRKSPRSLVEETSIEPLSSATP